MSAEKLLKDISVRIADYMDVCAVDARASMPGMRQGILIILENIDPDDYGGDPRGALGKMDFDKRAALKLARETLRDKKIFETALDQVAAEIALAQFFLGEA